MKAQVPKTHGRVVPQACKISGGRPMHRQNTARDAHKGYILSARRRLLFRAQHSPYNCGLRQPHTYPSLPRYYALSVPLNAGTFTYDAVRLYDGALRGCHHNTPKS